VKCDSLLILSIACGFAQDIAPENLYGRCLSFIEMESKNGIQSILTMLVHSSATDSFVTDYIVLFDKLARHALDLQESDLDYDDEIAGLLLDLTKLKPRFVNAVLQDFKRLGVKKVNFFWCKGRLTNWDSILGGDEDCHAKKSSILTNLVESLNECVEAGHIEMGWIDAKKLVQVWTLIEDPLLSQDAIKTYVSSELHNLSAEDIMGISPKLIKDLFCSAVSTSRSSLFMEEKIQHLCDLVDEVLLLNARRCPWDGSLDSQLNFQQMAACIPLNERKLHDKLHDAVAGFSRSFTQAESSEIWNMIDVAKLSPSRFEIAISIALSEESGYVASLFQRVENDRNSHKQKFSIVSHSLTCCLTLFL